MTDRLRSLSQLFGCILLIVLIAVYVPLSAKLKIIGFVAVFFYMLFFVLWTVYLRKTRSKHPEKTLLFQDLPPVGYQQPIIFVTGKGLSNLFGEKKVIEQPEGCFFRIDDTECLTDTLCHLITVNPLWASQLHVLHVLIPELHIDEASLRVGLKQWRWQLTRVHKQLGLSPTACLVSYFHDAWLVKTAMPEVNFVQDQPSNSPWFCQFYADTQQPFSIMSVDVYFEVRTQNQNRYSLASWLSEPSKYSDAEHRYAYALKLKVARDFLYNNLLSECWQDERLAKPVLPFALSIHFVPFTPITDNVWSRKIAERTGLNSNNQYHADAVQLSHNSQTFPLPDILFASLPQHRNVRQIEQITYRLILMCLVFIASVIVFSYQNNQRLINDIGEHLVEYYQISMGNEPSKQVALLQLKEDAKQLEYYYRIGEPSEYGAWLYQGVHIYPHILNAIATYIAPSPRLEPVVEVPSQSIKQPIRLDSLSLFDIGKFSLKQEATNGLIRAVVDIKAKPGYVILITGHTDNTGNHKENEVLSLKRAEAVRDWMMEVSDLPINCFAVQGYGASQPIASNTTEAGRQQNRRVEISLVPEISACKLTDVAPAL